MFSPLSLIVALCRASERSQMSADEAAQLCSLNTEKRGMGIKSISYLLNFSTHAVKLKSSVGTAVLYSFDFVKLCSHTVLWTVLCTNLTQFRPVVRQMFVRGAHDYTVSETLLPQSLSAHQTSRT